MAENRGQSSRGGQQGGQQEQSDQGVGVSIFLQPIAPPYILGLYAFAGGAAVVGTTIAGWYGPPAVALTAWPFVAAFGGLAQFAAALWGFRARNALATAIFGLWGSLWLAYGLLEWLFAASVLAQPADGIVPEMGVWFMVVAWVTVVGAYAATASSWMLTATLALATVAMAVAAAGEFGVALLLPAAGALLVATAVLAWYTASALLLESTFQREVLPIFPTAIARQAPVVQPGHGEPGVRRG